MRYSYIIPALASLALAAPQGIDIDGVEAAADPVFVTPAVNVATQVATVVPVASQAAAASAAISEDPASPTTTASSKRSLIGRDGTCAKQPAGSGAVSSPDTPQAFAVNPAYPALASGAPTPDGYSQAFVNLNASLNALNYMGLYTLTSYDTLGCANLCDRASGCQAFNMYVERDPTLDPNAVDCPNPSSLTNYKCTLWGAPVCDKEATNFGQWRDSFQVLIAGSNAYNKAAAPPAVPGYTGPTELGGAINAPLDAQGHNTYMGYKFYPFSQSQGYTPSTCAAACSSQTQYNQAHPAADGTFQTCTFFNSYVLSKNAIPQGLYCSLYNETWSPRYAVNYGQYRGSDRYTVSESYSYTLTAALTS
ncbi:hypothetical protein MBLNU459_g3984t1 [Dothideomycetes sp. NU459]